MTNYFRVRTVTTTVLPIEKLSFYFTESWFENKTILVLKPRLSQ